MAREDATGEIIAGTVVVGFHSVLPVEDYICAEQIRAAMARKLPEVLRRKRLTVIASGPSASGLDLQALEGPLMAVNGALDTFVSQDVEPDYWAACDSQALVADFIPDDPPRSTHYLVASKCHPSVFDRLKGRKVSVWHLKERPLLGVVQFPPSCSVTLTATWMMHGLGFTDFEYWGWDACYLDGEHHSGAGQVSPESELYVNYGGTRVGDRVMGGRNFPTRRSWVAEAQAAEQFFHLARYFDIGVTIHGDGMIACAYDSLREAA